MTHIHKLMVADDAPVGYLAAYGEPEPRRKIVFVSHAGCPDGVASEMVMRASEHNLSERSVEVVYATMGAGSIPSLSAYYDKDALLILCDVSSSHELLQHLVDKKHFGSVIVLDHHATAEKLLENAKDLPKDMLMSYTQMRSAGLDGWVKQAEKIAWNGVYKWLDMTRSGAQLAMQFFGANIKNDHYFVYAEFVDLVADRDLWQFKLPRTKQLHAWFSSEIGDKTSAYRINHLLTKPEHGINWMVERGSYMLKVESEMIKQLLQTQQELLLVRKDGSQVKVPFVFGQHGLASDLGNQMAQNHTSGLGIIITSVDDTTGTMRLSIRSKSPDISTLEITEAFGGGGHVCASGCSVPRGVIDERRIIL